MSKTNGNVIYILYKMTKSQNTQNHNSLVFACLMPLTSGNVSGFKITEKEGLRFWFFTAILGENWIFYVTLFGTVYIKQC